MVTNCNQLKIPAADGKFYKTDCMTTKQVLRLVQSIPSPKAEPFKLWLVEVGNQRFEEITDPEKAILRGADYYRAKGYTEGWINQCLQSIEMRKELTDEWKARGIGIASRTPHASTIGTKFARYKSCREKHCVSVF